MQDRGCGNAIFNQRVPQEINSVLGQLDADCGEEGAQPVSLEMTSFINAHQGRPVHSSILLHAHERDRRAREVVPEWYAISISKVDLRRSRPRLS